MEDVVSEDINLTLPRNFICHPMITATADRSKLSNAQLMMNISAILVLGSVKAKEVDISINTIRRARKHSRQIMSRSIISEFKTKVKSDYLTLHWDGKLMKQLSGKKFDYLTVLVRGSPNCPEGKILSIKPIQSGTGVSICRGILEDLEEWDLKKNIVAQVFDTTACNTGVRNGAATLLEETKSMKTLLWLACRHHVLELILGSFCNALF
ncbi:uncharacterized protein LOC136079008 [Hydra vulgaris]|uniref:Uncharacterized protein LOC136079008 n=1 Tax=Hydra vulgaris TaxID=6087 RepID=A0ABM4BP07_HYDVU